MAAISTMQTLILALGVAGEGDAASHRAAAAFASDLRRSSSVSIYFVARTEEYSYSPEVMKSESSFSLNRKCGGNCLNAMGPVVEHLRDSISAKCEGQRQDVLIELDGKPIVIYAQGGRAIQYRGKCYFNPAGIGRKIKEAGIIPLY